MKTLINICQATSGQITSCIGSKYFVHTVAEIIRNSEPETSTYALAALSATLVVAGITATYDALTKENPRTPKQRLSYREIEELIGKR